MRPAHLSELPAGGIAHAVLPISYPDLLALTSAQPVAVA
jgi:hypothetical protein